MSSCIFCRIVHYPMKALEKALECLFRQRRWPLFSVYIIDRIYAVSWKSFSVIILSVEKWQSGFKGLCGRIQDMNHHHLLCSKLELMAIGSSVTLKILDKQQIFAVFDAVSGQTLGILWLCVVFYMTFWAPCNPPNPNTVFGKKLRCTTEPLKGINTRLEENTYFNTFSRSYIIG